MPVLTATGAGVRHRRRWLFRDLDVTAEPGDVIAVIGVPGSGRTTVLLALTDHFRLSAGKVELSGAAVLGHVPAVTEPEPVLSVAEHLRERLALLGRPRREAAAVIADGLYGVDPALRGWQLTPFQKQLLGLGLARLAKPVVIGLDGLDDGLDAAEQEELWDIIEELAGAGISVIVTAREIDPDRAATVIRLGDPQAFDSSGADQVTPSGETAGESPRPTPAEGPDAASNRSTVEEASGDGEPELDATDTATPETDGESQRGEADGRDRAARGQSGNDAALDADGARDGEKR